VTCVSSSSFYPLFVVIVDSQNDSGGSDDLYIKLCVFIQYCAFKDHNSTFNIEANSFNMVPPSLVGRNS
jgi:hypothetical protein